MEDEVFQWVTIILIVLVLLSSISIARFSFSAEKILEQESSCPAVLDVIYEHCKEETSIELYTMQGRNVTLKYINNTGCVIK